MKINIRMAENELRVLRAARDAYLTQAAVIVRPQARYNLEIAGVFSDDADLSGLAGVSIINVIDLIRIEQCHGTLRVRHFGIACYELDLEGETL